MIRKLLQHFILPTLITVAIIYFALRGIDSGVKDSMIASFGNVRSHAPNLALVMLQPTAIQIHLTAALLAFILGLVQILGPKGKMPHRILGWVWVGLMLVTAISSFFIKSINPGHFSLIHALSGWTVVVAPMVIYWARKHDIKRHRSTAIGLFMGGLIIAGAFTFLPGRLMWRVFFG
ncbi:DUF2306 domain-containing protein [Asticcacaulis sp. SL142]|uniref:DUF2306 domain-containing protein n=1 Tax=Asticcacaulis sp. SL142 TaxID=2995155 RepID=UPI00226CF9EA|nr:DUF2306 domain-containing protein [Asticcacaulis sp. SL142]WAC47411.1 DUF2306 domain-containing protein [Asticcacaulis sp. SL142]